VANLHLSQQRSIGGEKLYATPLTNAEGCAHFIEQDELTNQQLKSSKSNRHGFNMDSIAQESISKTKKFNP
jgi:hypothetical protein